MTARDYKEMSLKEFSKAATVYETDKAGVYKMCMRTERMRLKNCAGKQVFGWNCLRSVDCSAFTA